MRRPSAKDRGWGKGRNAGKKYCIRLIGVKSSSDLRVSWVGNEPWASSKPGSFGTGVVACL